MVVLVNQLTIPVFLDVANAIAKSGKPVTLFTGKVEESHTSLFPGIQVVHSIAYRRRSLLSRMITWSIFALQLWVYLMFKRGMKHILVVTNPPLAPIVVSWIARWRKIPYTVLVYDLYPEALSQAGVSSERNWIFTRWKKINPSVFNPARSLITLSESMKAALKPYVATPDRIQIIPNWVETAYIKPVAKTQNPFLTRYGLHDKMVVLYSGNMGLTHDLESLLAAAALVRDHARIFFVMVGDGAKRAKLLAMKESTQLENVLFLPYQSVHDFPYAMAAADIGVVTLGVGAEGISVPSKTYINMAAGACLLTIAPRGSELNRLVETYQCGYICEPRKPQAIAAFLITMLKDQGQLARFKENARKASLHFGSENANRYVEVVKD